MLPMVHSGIPAGVCFLGFFQAFFRSPDIQLGVLPPFYRDYFHQEFHLKFPQWSMMNISFKAKPRIPSNILPRISQGTFPFPRIPPSLGFKKTQPEKMIERLDSNPRPSTWSCWIAATLWVPLIFIWNSWQKFQWIPCEKT